MNRLIDRADLFNRLANIKTLAEAFAVIQNMPTAEPRRGRWIWDAYMDSIACSECGFMTIAEYNFCPYCGAKMDEGRD